MERKTRQLSVIDLLKNSDETSSVARLGFCRTWTKKAIELVKKIPNLDWSARRIVTPDDQEHTFLRLRTQDGETILCDGMGVNKSGPYFGPEDEAPKILLNSSEDPINDLL